MTESFEDTRSAFLTKVGGVITGVKDPATHNAKNMETTLANLKKAAEAG